MRRSRPWTPRAKRAVTDPAPSELPVWQQLAPPPAHHRAPRGSRPQVFCIVCGVLCGTDPNVRRCPEHKKVYRPRQIVVRPPARVMLDLTAAAVFREMIERVALRAWRQAVDREVVTRPPPVPLMAPSKQKHPCLDCGTPISIQSARCRSCAPVFRKSGARHGGASLN